MIKDITIGQYFPGNSVIHRLDSRVKLVLDILYLVILFTAQSYTGSLLGMLFMVMCYMLARIKPVMILKKREAYTSADDFHRHSQPVFRQG